MSIDQQLSMGNDPASPENDGSTTDRRLRLRLPIAMLVLFWPLQLAIANLEMAMLPRFLSRTILTLLLLLGFLGWWLANRYFDLPRKLVVIVVAVASCLVATLAADRSQNLFGMLLTGLPFLMTAATVWLLVARRLSMNVQTCGVAVVFATVFAVLSLLRFEGLDGRQHAGFNWRWTPTAEAQFLATIDRSSNGVQQSSDDAPAWTLQTGDWPGFRGADREGILRDAPAIDWKNESPRPVWRHRIGPGWSSMIVVDGHLVTQEQRGASEAVVCYDADTGKEIWAHGDELRFQESLSGAGPRATPTFDQGRLYTVGGSGKVNCLSAASGKRLWSHDLIEENGAAVPQWGVSFSPLLVDDLVVVYAGGDKDRGLIAYRADSGEVAWSSPAGQISYSSPHLLTIAGVRQIVMHDNRALFAVDPKTGELLWERAGSNEMFLPMLQPHQVGDNELVVNWESGIARLKIEKGAKDWTVSEVWTSNRLKPTFNDFYIHEDAIYGLDDGILCCVDLADGKRLWKGGRYGFGQLLLLPDRDQVLVLWEKGEVVGVETSRKRLEELGRFSGIEGKTWNHPVIAHGKLYVRNGEEIACYDLGPVSRPDASDSAGTN
jgi:outer membrane protein assembly factor BamB